MSNFSIEFTYPWLLLLLIPAVVLTLIPYFRLKKRYRRTRNRVTSVVLHLIVMVLSILALSGMTFSYSVVNTQNEMIILVDVSDSGQEVAESRDKFVSDLVFENENAGVKLGIVTFGYTQVYAVEMTYDMKDVYAAYEQSLEENLPDVTATDIASALTYAKSLFANPATGKIILISDGLETDSSAASLIKSVIAEGITIDTVCFTPSYEEDEVQVNAVTLPAENLAVGTEFEITVTLMSSVATSPTEPLSKMTVYDIYGGTETAGGSVEFSLVRGSQDITLTHTFNLPGLHTLRFEITSESGDLLNENNTYYAYYDLQVYDEILIVERTSGEASQLSALLADYNYENVTVVSVTDEDNLPSTVKEMRAYDEVILMNISNADMPEGFIDVLYSYVYDYGGGLLTVGGNDESGEANLYNRTDLYGTTYQDMLPVQAVNYTPPLGVIFILDTSGSMSSILDAVKEAAISSLQALSERDYCGIVTLASSYNEEIELLPMTRYAKILEAINNIDKASGSTMFSPAITYSVRALYSNQNISKRHIVLITDGQPSSSDEEAYFDALTYGYGTCNVTTSIVTISSSSSSKMEEAAAAGGGQYYHITRNEADSLADILREDLSLPEITEMVYETFTPTIAYANSTVVAGVSQEDMPTLDGFYGTKAKSDATVILEGDYEVPIYAQWDYGAGKVGSFLCDMEGIWSSNFLASITGQQIISNMVAALLPTEDIAPYDISVTMTEDNYSTQMNIYTELTETQTVSVTVTFFDGTVTVYTPNEATGYSRLTLPVTLSGVHEILVEKMENGEAVSSLTVYKSFSYSAEYDYFVDTEEGIALMASLAESGNGAVLSADSADEAYTSFAKTLSMAYDPRLPLLIAALVLFLLDIAVRKFKWKWPHEIVRDRRHTRELEGR